MKGYGRFLGANVVNFTIDAPFISVTWNINSLDNIVKQILYKTKIRL